MIDVGTASVIASALATLGLFFYAGVQTSLQRRAERARVRERSQDESRAVDLARAAVNAEFFRLWTIAKQIESADLEQWATDGKLDPDDLLPADWAGLNANVGRLGLPSAGLACYALAMARDASLAARTLVSLAREGRYTPASTEASKVKEKSMEAALLLEDAMAHCLRADVPFVVDTDIPMKSKTGARVLEELAKRREAVVKSYPTGKRRLPWF